MSQLLSYAPVSFGHVSVSDDSLIIQFLKEKKKLDVLALEDTLCAAFRGMQNHVSRHVPYFDCDMVNS